MREVLYRVIGKLKGSILNVSGPQPVAHEQSLAQVVAEKVSWRLEAGCALQAGQAGGAGWVSLGKRAKGHSKVCTGGWSQEVSHGAGCLTPEEIIEHRPQRLLKHRVCFPR